MLGDIRHRQAGQASRRTSHMVDLRSFYSRLVSDFDDKIKRLLRDCASHSPPKTNMALRRNC